MTPKALKKSLVPSIDLKISFFEDRMSDSEKGESRNLTKIMPSNTVKFAEVADLYYSTATETHSFLS